tara:strand:- start:2 stop:1210 length:1209 start_codon:yes stop_codon:yes gene_type:complete
MNILIVHEIDWIKKVPFEPHHLAEIFSTKQHQVFVIDCAEPNLSDILRGLHTSTIKDYHRLYDHASITLIRPSSLLIKGLNRLTYFLSCKKTIKKILVENSIDLIFLYGVATNGIQCIELSRELNIPIVFRALDVAHKLVRIPCLQNHTKKLEKSIFSSADLVLTTTPQLSNYAEEMGSNSDCIKYFPLGVNSRYFKPMKKNNELFQELGIQTNDRIILFMGTLYPFSGIDHILKNFHLLQNKIKQIKFVIIGGGPDFNRLKSLSNELQLNKNIIFTGFVEQKKIPEYIAIADICLNPFVINTLTDRVIPTKILEYLACGKPVLSTPLKGTVELLPNENYGIVYSQLDDFISSIEKLLQNKAHLDKLGENGFSYVKKNHYWDSLADQLIKIFDNLIKNQNND